MVTKKSLDRINELSKKSKEVGLSPEEKVEQDQLRKEYLADFRSRMVDELTSIKIVDEKGNDITPAKLKYEKAKRKKNLH
ncbi:DUF896 domain-containing protein [Gottfriedia acidiceleris]|uniref:DUF896 domain-containing protein n=1 Tax=Bacillaceae TaxID=186817 RepID=UPI000BEBC165|nr:MULTISPECIES: DUF896 domain-containing protein [unclassified Bacillus (in: firmicutes)]PEC48948.1 hypothetical protein CON00_15365 [Bacillus sp. AFS096315]PFM82947.1 hypothetical protein COJ46_03820 [Bacillus sp. AFS077874]